jgi:glyoxylate utilization-related uncharacterized protein
VPVLLVLSGTLTMEVDGQTHEVSSHHGVEIVPAHRTRRETVAGNDVVFWVISSPASRVDRYEVLDGGTYG